MTTESERISHLEGIAEQTNVTLASIQRSQESLRTEIGDLRKEMQTADAALSTKMEISNAALLIAIGDLRAEMQTADAALRIAMVAGDESLRTAMVAGDAALLAAIQAGDAAIRADIANNARTTRLIGFSAGAAVIAALAAALFGIYFT